MSLDDLRRDPASLYTLAVEQATDYVIFLLDPEGRVANWTPPVGRLMGWSAEAFVGRPFASLFTDADRADGVPGAILAEATERGQHRYTRWHATHGAGLWAHGRVGRLDDASGLVGFIVSIQDVTAMKAEEERHRQEEASLRHRAAELEALLDVVPIGIGIARNADASHVQVNAAFADLLRVPLHANASLSAPEGERPGHFKVLKDGKVLPPHDLPLQRAARTARPVSNLEVDVVFDSGERLRLLEHAAPLFDEHGAVRGSIGAFVDITARADYEDQRERMLGAEREARQEAERLNLIKDEFLAGLSHEIRTPLTAILGWTQILCHMAGLPPDARMGLEVIERNARLQTRLIDDLLDLSRIVSGKLVLEFQPVVLASVAQAALSSIQPSADAKGVRLATAIDPDAGCVTGDAVRLQQVLWNLLSNAVKFTPRGGQIDVVMARVGDTVGLTVADTGIGIAPDFLPYVFDRFRQADGSTTRSHGGIGVGLSIVKQLVELHGGTVHASSAGQGRGATFTVALPAATLYASGVKAPASWTTDTPPLDGIAVLVVEDDDDSRALLEAMLRWSGASVVTAASAHAALDRLAERTFDVLVSDIGLPALDGYALIRAIRALPSDRAAIPAIALTAYARSEDRRQAELAGFQVHLPKPVDKSDLCAAVARLARPAR